MQDTNIISTELYTLVSNSLDKNSKKFLANIASYIQKKHTQIFDIAPYKQIYFNKPDIDDMFKSLNLNEKEVLKIIKKCYYFEMKTQINPRCIKEPYIDVLLCCIRYYIINKDDKNAEFTTIYLAFSGKIYASLHHDFWRKFDPIPQVMDYVINNMLSDKFDLKKEGSVFGAMRKLSSTWLDTYKIDIKNCDSDDDWKIYLQQLRDRVKSFLNNIAKLYFKAYNEKLYLNYETDDLNPDNFRLTDNDSTKAARITEATMNVLTSQRVSIDLCDKCANDSIKSLDVKNIIESMLSNKENIPIIRRIINIIICDYMSSHPGKRVGSADFISYTIKAKPNTKSEILIELKESLMNLIRENSPRFRDITRIATINNYYRAIISYYTFQISLVAATM